MIHILITILNVFALMTVLGLIGCELVLSAQKIADALGIDGDEMGIPIVKFVSFECQDNGLSAQRHVQQRVQRHIQQRAREQRVAA
jgi:hypothetical protein